MRQNKFGHRPQRRHLADSIRGVLGEPEITVTAECYPRGPALRRMQRNVCLCARRIEPPNMVAGRIGKPDSLVGPGRQALRQYVRVQFEWRRSTLRRYPTDSMRPEFREPQVAISPL